MLNKPALVRNISVSLNFFVILAILSIAGFSPADVQAMGPIVVNTVVETHHDGLCSLREAIINANTNSQLRTDCNTGAGNDVIVFSDALGTATIVLPSSLPAITDLNGLTINGGNDITISGNGAVQVFAVFAIGRLTLNNLTIKDGRSPITNIGAAIYNIGTLEVNNCTLVGNSAIQGGAIFNSLTGGITITNSNFLSNHADNKGGGIYNEGGALTVNNGSFSDNTSTFGGGIANMGSAGGTINITGTSFSGNTSSDSGGGIYNRAGNSLNINNASFLQNASSLGGGIYNLGTLTLTDTILSGNGGWYGGGIYNDKGTLTIQGGNFSQNVADFGAGIYTFKGTVSIGSGVFTENIGGGIFNESGTLEVIRGEFASNTGNGIYSHSGPSIFDAAIVRIWNSNFIKNTGSGVYNDYAGTNIFKSTFYGNGDSGVHNVHQSVVTIDKSTLQFNAAWQGAGVYNEKSILHLYNSTISENIARYKGGGLYNNGTTYVLSSTFSDNLAKYHDGLFNDKSGLVELYNTILANGRNSGDDCRNDPGGTVTGNNNLIEALSGDACGFIDGIDGNIIGRDPDLAMLTGSPAYYPLNNGSPAIDAGDDAQCVVTNPSQNGVARPQGAHCDIGSYEAPASTGVPTPQEAVVDLGGKVQGLVDTGALSGEDGKMLTALLDASILAFDKGDAESGIKTLTLFTDQVAALMKAGNLKTEPGQELINVAQDIIDSIY